MPAYTNEKESLPVTREMLEEWLKQPATKYKRERDRALAIALYLFGARPYELTLLKKEDVFVLPEAPDYINVRLFNAKLGIVKGYKVRDRVLIIHKDSAFLNEFMRYAAQFDKPEARLFPISTTRMKQLIYAMTGSKACPYTFRHNRLARLARLGDVGVTDLMAWKGAQDTRSVSAYLANKPNLPRRLD